MLKPHFQEFAAYNQWATARLYDALAPLPAEDLSRDVGVFFGSIIGTLNHIITTDRIWLARMTGEGSFPKELNARLSDDLLELKKMALSEADRLAAHVEGLTEEALAAPFTYRTLNGTEHTQLRRESLAQLLNHQTHHRSQATTCLTILGADFPVLDLLFFQRHL